MVNFITALVICIISYYIIYSIQLLFLKNREVIQTKNKKLEKMRKIAVKSLQQQKNFIKIKFDQNKKTDYKKIIFNVILFSIFFFLFSFIVDKKNIVFNVWQGLFLIVFLIFIFNMVLKPFKLNNSDINEMLKL